jgi:hypothetical protein
MIAGINGQVSVPVDGGAVPVSHASPIPENGWPLRPFQIVSLLEMIEFQAGEFFGLLNRLIHVRKDLEKDNRAPLTQNEREAMHHHANHADAVCAKYDIDVSYYTNRARRKIDQPEQYTFSLASAVDAVKHCILEKLDGHKFLYIPAADAAYYDSAHLFGEAVAVSFSEAESDIRAAGNCIACGLYTACVFHLMRVAEFGLRRIAIKLRVRLKDRGKYHPVEYATWDKVITNCKGKIDKIRQKPVGSKKQADLEFYSDAADHCLFMKDIWRNNISHTRQPYNEPEALAVLERVRDFMKFLTVNAL